jgi:hypothetical protein
MSNVKKKRDNVVSFRINDDEIECLRKICRMNCKRMSDLMRDALLSYNSNMVQVTMLKGRELN